MADCFSRYLSQVRLVLSQEMEPAAAIVEGLDESQSAKFEAIRLCTLQLLESAAVELATDSVDALSSILLDIHRTGELPPGITSDGFRAVATIMQGAHV